MLPEWVGSPSCIDPEEVEQLLIENRNNLTLVGAAKSDDEEIAIVLLDDRFYICHAVAENWCVMNVCNTLAEVEKHLVRYNRESIFGCAWMLDALKER